MPNVVPGVIVETSLQNDAEAASEDRTPTPSGGRKHDIPDWLQPSTEGLVEGESGSSGSAGETSPITPPPNIPARPSNKLAGKHNLFIQFLASSHTIMLGTGAIVGIKRRAATAKTTPRFGGLGSVRKSVSIAVSCTVSAQSEEARLDALKQPLWPHNPWQDSTQWWQGWRGGWKSWDDSTLPASLAHFPVQVSDERVTTAVRTVQNQTCSIRRSSLGVARKRCSQNTGS